MCQEKLQRSVSYRAPVLSHLFASLSDFESFKKWDAFYGEKE